jgi:hypothetical protein
VGFKFRKSRRSIKILPGVRLNTGKKGITSVSIGGRGKLFSSTTNISSKGVKNSFTINGVGTFTSTPDKQPNPRSAGQRKPLTVAAQESTHRGDTKTLEDLINSVINPKGFECLVTNSADLLKILIRGKTAPDRALVKPLRELIESTKIQGYSKVTVTARPIRGKVAWSDEWALEAPQANSDEPTPTAAPAPTPAKPANSAKLTVTPASNKTLLKGCGFLLAAGFSLLWFVLIASAIASIYQGRQLLEVANVLIDKSATTESDLVSLEQSSKYLEQARSELEGISILPGAGSKPAQLKISEINEKLSSVQSRISEEETKISVQAKAVQDLEGAKQLAKQASEVVQNPPHPISTWEEAKTAWASSIQLLEGIPAETDAYNEAQEKLTGYRNNLKAIENRITVENQAIAKYEESRQAGDELITLTRSLVYPGRDDLPKLKEAQTGLEKAIQQLRTIPNGTSQYTNAQSRLQAHSEDYQELVKAVKEIETCKNDPSLYYSSCMVFSKVRVSTFSDSEASYGDTPVRESRSGSCQCPYDRDSAGNSCGSRSAYSRPGGSSPICYK